MSDNVIEFPLNDLIIMNKEAESAANVIDDMKKTKALEMSNYLAESILMAGAKEMVAHGVDVNTVPQEV